MNSRERIFAALEHREPDRVPYDLAGMHCTGIHIIAYKNLCKYLGMNPEPIQFADVIQQAVIPKQEMLEKFQVDTRGLFPLCSHNWNVKGKDRGDYYEHVDEWGFIQRFPKENGLWWSQVKSPLDDITINARDIIDYPWPLPELPERIAGLRPLARKYRAQEKVIILKGLCAGLLEMAQRVRGMENILCDLLGNPENAGLLLDKILDLKKRFWSLALDELGDLVDIVVETDDYGTQESQLISYQTFRDFIAPRLRELVRHLKSILARKKGPGKKGYIFFHSCGNIRPFIPDFIEMGIDIINPVHINAAGMEPARLKRDFGDHITFWGGGVQTQNILPNGTTRQVTEDVKKNLAALMPGGGYVFNPVHNIQSEVPPENIVVMWEALQKYGCY